jgi:hypothetical protein
MKKTKTKKAGLYSAGQGRAGQDGRGRAGSPNTKSEILEFSLSFNSQNVGFDGA